MTKISVGIATSIKLKHRYDACKSTWGKDFEHIYYFGSSDVDKNELIPVPDADDDYNSFFPKQQYALKYMFEKNPNDDWYCVIGCDHILLKNNIVNFLIDKNSDFDLLYCQTYNNNRYMSIEGLEFEIFAGGGAFFISNSLMKKIYPLIDDFNKEWLNYYRSGKLPESCYACGDVALSFLVKKYFDLKLSHVEGMYSQNPNFYPSIVENPLTFHYIPAHEMLSIYDKYSYL